MPEKIIDDDFYAAFEMSLGYWVMLVISCTGLVTNTLNVLVFARQGYKEGINISMTCIALWDFLKCFVDVIDRMDRAIGLVSSVMSVSFRNTTRFYFKYTHVISGTVSCVIATYVSIERCVCVCRPFTVKSVFTPKFTLFMVTAISVVTFGAFVVVYFIWDVLQVYSPEFNTTISINTFSNFYYTHGHVVMPYYQTIAFLLPSASFVVLCVCSVVTVHNLRKSTQLLRKVRASNLSSRGQGTSGFKQREKQVVKMLLVVIVVYIGNLFPRIIFYIAQLIEPEFYFGRLYSNLFNLIGDVMFILDEVNAAVNFFIFVKMSSNFRATFNVLFPCARKRF